MNEQERIWLDRGSADNRELVLAPTPGGDYVIAYRQPTRHGGRWSWRVDRGFQPVAGGWRDTEAEAKAAAAAVLVGRG